MAAITAPIGGDRSREISATSFIAKPARSAVFLKLASGATSAGPI